MKSTETYFTRHCWLKYRASPSLPQVRKTGKHTIISCGCQVLSFAFKYFYSISKGFYLHFYPYINVIHNHMTSKYYQTRERGGGQLFEFWESVVGIRHVWNWKIIAQSLSFCCILRKWQSYHKIYNTIRDQEFYLETSSICITCTKE